MVRLRTQFRHLYVLALFQLVGGPLVLVAMLSMTRAVVQETAEHGLLKGVAGACQGEAWEKTCEWIAHTTLPETQPKVPGSPEKAKDGPGKLVWMPWAVPASAALHSGAMEKPWWAWIPMNSQWANAPPSPPPRVV